MSTSLATAMVRVGVDFSRFKPQFAAGLRASLSSAQILSNAEAAMAAATDKVVQSKVAAAQIVAAENNKMARSDLELAQVQRTANDMMIQADKRFAAAEMEAAQIMKMAKIKGVDAMAEANAQYDALLAERIAAEQRATGMIALAENERQKVSLAGSAAMGAAQQKVLAATAAAAATERAIAEQQIESNRQRIRSHGLMGAAVIVGEGLIAFKLARMASTFQASMQQIASLAGVPQSSLQSLSHSVLALSGQVGYSPNSLAQALYHVESSMAGMVGKGLQFRTEAQKQAAALNAVRLAAMGAQIGNANLTDTTNALGSIIAAGKLKVSDYTAAMQIMLHTVGSGDMTMTNFVQAMSNGLVSTARLYGASMQDVGAGLATLGDHLIRGRQAATSLRMAFQDLAVGTGKSDKVLRSDLGITLKQLQDRMTHGGLLSAMTLLHDRIQALKIPTSQVGTILTQAFTKRAGVGLGVLLDDFGRLKSKYADFGKSGQTIDEAWKNRLKTFDQQQKNLGANFKSLGTSLGLALLPALTKILSAINKVFTYIETHKTVLKAVEIGFGVLAAVITTTAVVAIGMAIASFDALGVVMGAIFSPIGLIVAAVAGLVFGFYQLYQHSALVRDIISEVGKFFVSAWNMIVQAWSAAPTWFANIWNDIKRGMKPVTDWIHSILSFMSQWWKSHGAQVMQVVHALQYVLASVWAAILQTVKVVWKLIVLQINVSWSIISNFLKVGLTIIQAAWTMTWHLLVNTVKIVWNLIRNVVTFAIHQVMGVIGIALDIITGHWSKAWSDIKHFVSQTFHDIGKIIGDFAKGAITLLLQAGKDLIQGLINGVHSMIGAVGKAVGGIASKVKHFFTNPLGIFSPSKVFHQFGIYIIQGLINGLNSSQSALDKTMYKIGLLLVKHGDMNALGYLVAFKRRIDPMVHVFDGLKAKLATAMNSLNAMIQQKAAYASQVSQQYVNNVFSSGGPSNFNGIVSSLNGQIMKNQSMTQALDQLKKMGLNQAMLDEIANSPDSLAAAKSVLSQGVGGVKQLNALQAQMQLTANQVGNIAASNMYDAGIKTAQGVVDGLKKKEVSLTKIMVKLANSFVATMEYAMAHQKGGIGWTAQQLWQAQTLTGSAHKPPKVHHPAAHHGKTVHHHHTTHHHHHKVTINAHDLKGLTTLQQLLTALEKASSTTKTSARSGSVPM